MRELFIENPMFIEVKRFWRRFFGVSRSGTGNFAVACLVALAYLSLLLLSIKYRSSTDASAFLMIETFLFCLIIPSMLHGAIAGEREKRTWDLLAVAPITKAQIVVGKFMSAGISILVVSTLLLIPALIMDNGEIRNRGGSIFAAHAIAVGYAFMLGGLTMLVSAASKRSFGAQGGIYGLQILGLLIWPMLTSIFTAQSFSPSRQDFVLYLHPFHAQSRVFQESSLGGGRVPFNGITHLLLYLFLTALLLFWAVRRLQTDDGRDRG